MNNLIIIRTFRIMNKTLRLKRVMMAYLDTTYPEIYLLKLDFLGDVVQTFDEEKKLDFTDNRTIGRSSNSWYDMRKEVINTLVLMFSINKVTAENVLNDWVNCRPKYEYVRNSMDEQVLIPVVEENCMTI